ncbi:MAG TPA: DUF6252 family protein [Flavobacterium sp.]|jgi:hypothetical protein
MKAFKSLTKFSVVAVFLIVAGCSSDDDDNNTPTPTPSTPNGTYLKGKVDGTSWQSLELQGQSLAVAVTSGEGTGRLIMINGSGDINGSDSMVINLLGIDAPGTYTINSDSDSVLAYVNTATETSYDTSDCSGATGTVTITTINTTKVEGTFSFVGKVDEDCSQTKTIAEGQFRGVFMQN